MGEWLHISGEITVLAFIHREEGEKGFKRLLRKYFNRRLDCHPDCTSKKCRYCQEYFAVPCGWNGPMDFRIDQTTMADPFTETPFVFARARVHIFGDLEDRSDKEAVKDWLEKCFVPHKKSVEDISTLCQEAKDGKIPDKSLRNRKLYLTDAMVKIDVDRVGGLEYLMYDDANGELKIIQI